MIAAAVHDIYYLNIFFIIVNGVDERTCGIGITGTASSCQLFRLFFQIGILIQREEFGFYTFDYFAADSFGLRICKAFFQHLWLQIIVFQVTYRDHAKRAKKFRTVVHLWNISHDFF